MSIEFDTQVVIVGMGPVGATLANLLGKAGIEAIVVERGLEPVDTPRAIHFDASVMRIFQSIGIEKEMEAQCRLLERMETYGADGQLLGASTPGTGEDGWEAHYNFYQPRLEATLGKALSAYPSVSVLRGAEVTSVTQDDAGATVTWISEGETTSVRAEYVLAADGASSTVRKLLGLKLENIDFDEPWLVVDAMVEDGSGLSESASQMYCDPRRPHTLVPGPGAHHRWEFMLLEGEHPDEMTRPEKVAELISAHTDPALVDIIRASVYRFHALVGKDWGKGRVFLLGDAVHQTPPFLGQGMCHGIRDAAALAWRLRAIFEGASPQILESYQAEREPQVRFIIGLAVAKGREICILDPVAARERDQAALARSAWAGTLNSTLVLSVDAGIVHPTRSAGVRAVPQVLPDGQLLDDLLPADFLILSAAETPTAGAVCEAELHGLRAFDVTSPSLQTWLSEHNAKYAIVRPDRHAYAFASDDADLATKVNDLRQILASAE